MGRGPPEAQLGGDEPAAAVVELEREHSFERRAEKPLVRERAATQHQQPAPANRHEVRDQRELGPREDVAFDVGDQQGVVREERLSCRRKARDQRLGAAATRLHQKRVLARVVLPLPHDRVDLETGVGGERAREETVLVAGRALQREHAAPAPRRADQHAARVVLDHRLAGLRGQLGGVDRGVQRIGRHGERLIHRSSVRSWRDRTTLDEAAVRQHAEIERRTTEAVRHGRYPEIDRGLVETRISG